MFILLNNELWTSSLKRQSLLFIMCSLMILTKAAFIAVASLILFQIWETFKVQRKWDLRAALFIPILVQCVSLLKNPDHVQSPSILKMNLADVAWTLLTAPIVNLSRTFFYFIGSDLFKIILTLSVLVLIFKKKDQLFLNKPAISKITLLGLIALYFCHTFLGVASLNTRIVVPYPRGIDNFTDMRGFFIGAITSLVVIWMLIDKLKFQFPILSRFFMGFLFFFSIFSVPYRFSSPREPALPMVGSPEWQQVWPEAKRESFCIPINPYPWFMMKNCRALQSIPEYSQMKNHEFGLYKLQESISKYQISVLGFKAPENSELRVAENERIEFKKIKGQNGISYFFPSLALNGNFTFLLQETNVTRKNPIEHFEKSASFENIIVLGH